MTQRFKASIILACHDVEDFIDDALSSIVAQSEFENFEVIPVDDGSSDATWQIIEEYRDRYPENFFPIRFAEGSGGPGRPRNAGLDRATAEYVIFMDPDDRILGDGYSDLLHAMEEHQSDIVIATRYGVPEGGGPEDRLWTDWIAPRPYVNGDSYPIKINLLRQRPVILKSIYRRARIEEWNLRFLERVRSCEDEIFDKKYLLLSERITKINDVVYLYTVARTGSITTKIRLAVFEDLDVLLPGLDDALSVYFDDSIVSSRVAALLRTFYFPKMFLLIDGSKREALEITRKACEEFGFDRLERAAHPTDRWLAKQLRARRYSAIITFFQAMHFVRTSPKARRAVNSVYAAQRFVARTRRSIVNLPKTARKAAPLAKEALTSEGRRKVWATRVRPSLAGEPNGYWLFMDRRDKASDNGEALYRYVRDNGIHDKIAFVIRRDCPDYDRLVADGFNVLAYDTLEQWRVLYNCEHFFGSHVDHVVIYPWTRFGAPVGTPRYKLNFLQHGIIRSDLSSWLGTKSYHTFCASAWPEYQGLLDNPRYGLTPETLKLTGLARHDLLKARDGDYVLVSPTWRSFLLGVSTEAFLKSDFYRNWHALLYDADVAHALTEAGVKFRLLLHRDLARFSECFPAAPHLEVVQFEDVTSFSAELSSAKMMVTDYSTIAFDVLYLRRPVVYFMFPESQVHSTNTDANLDLYRELGDAAETPAQAAAAIISVTAREYQILEEKASAIDAFFAHSPDGNNRKRFIDTILEMESSK